MSATCHGDSGGPVIVQGNTYAEDIQVGIVSYGTTDSSCLGKPGEFYSITACAVHATAKWNVIHRLLSFTPNADVFTDVAEVHSWIEETVAQLTHQAWLGRVFADPHVLGFDKSVHAPRVKPGQVLQVKSNTGCFYCLPAVSWAPVESATCPPSSVQILTTTGFSLSAELVAGPYKVSTCIRVN